MLLCVESSYAQICPITSVLVDGDLILIHAYCNPLRSSFAVTFTDTSALELVVLIVSGVKEKDFKTGAVLSVCAPTLKINKSIIAIFFIMNS